MVLQELHEDTIPILLGECLLYGQTPVGIGLGGWFAVYKENGFLAIHLPEFMYVSR